MEAHSSKFIFLAATYFDVSKMQQDAGLLFLLFILLFLSFAIAGSEVAFFSLSYKDIQVLKTKNHKPLKRIVDLLEDPKKLLTSMLIANSFINICIILVSNILIDHLFIFDQIPIPGFEFIIKVLAVTLMLLFFGEIMPKVMATQNNIRFAQDFGGVIQAVYFIFSRMSGMMVKYTNLIEKKLAQKDTGNTYSMEELDHAIELTTSPNHLDSEKKILKGIVKFGNITVRQIMKTRLDVYGVEDNITYNELLESVKEHNYSRFPVYKEDLDTIVGIIHTKDLIPHLQEEAAYAWQKLIRPVLFVHEQKMIEDLLKSMIKKIDDFHYIIEGKTAIIDFCNFIDIPTNFFDAVKGESDTVAGLILELAGEFPAVQQVVKYKQFSFTALDIQKNRIHKVQSIITPITSISQENG